MDEDAAPQTPEVARIVKAFVPAEYVSSNVSAYDAMVKMHARNEGIIFDNIDGDLKLMARPVFEDEDAVGAEDLEFQVAILNEDDDEALSKALEREFDGAFDMEDDDVFIVDGIEIEKMSELDPKHVAVEKFRMLVNRVHSWRLCVCGLGFVKNADDAFCLRCAMTCSDVEREAIEDRENDCIICMEPSGTRYSRVMDCCKKRVHDKCIRRWLATSSSCPHCRTAMSNRVEVIIDLIE